MSRQSNAVHVVVRHEPDQQRLTQALLLVLLRPQQASDPGSQGEASQNKEPRKGSE